MMPKFRFWYEREDFYPDENYMRHVWGIEYIADDKIKLNDDYIFNPYTNVAENIYAKTKIYLMQCTGSKDKNGVEVFEGDIIKGRGGLASFIEFDEDDLSFKSVSRDCGKLYVPNGYLNKYTEVIGNIHENPELLEVTG